MPDAAREIIFPEGVPLSHQKRGDDAGAGAPSAKRDHAIVATKAEGGLDSEKAVIDFLIDRVARLVHDDLQALLYGEPMGSDDGNKGPDTVDAVYRSHS